MKRATRNAISLLCALYMAAYFSQSMVVLPSDAFVNTSVFCADLRLELGGKTIAARLVRGLEMRHERTRNAFSSDEGSDGGGNNLSSGILIVYDQRSMEMCITARFYSPGPVW